MAFNLAKHAQGEHYFIKRRQICIRFETSTSVVTWIRTFVNNEFYFEVVIWIGTFVNNEIYLSTGRE